MSHEPTNLTALVPDRADEADSNTHLLMSWIEGIVQQRGGDRDNPADREAAWVWLKSRGAEGIKWTDKDYELAVASWAKNGTDTPTTHSENNVAFHAAVKTFAETLLLVCDAPAAPGPALKIRCRASGVTVRVGLPA